MICCFFRGSTPAMPDAYNFHKKVGDVKYATQIHGKKGGVVPMQFNCCPIKSAQEAQNGKTA